MGKRRIVIEKYDPAWPEAFQRVARRVRDAFGSRALRVDHIGSTSVPGLGAKNIIDLQVTVADLEFIDEEYVAHLREHGFIMDRPYISDHVPAGRPTDPGSWAKRYADAMSDGRVVHVHIRVSGRSNQRYPLLFRDYLRASPQAARSYDLIKRELARLHGEDVDAYYAVKDPVCDLIIDAAEQWAIATHWTPGPPDA